MKVLVGVNECLDYVWDESEFTKAHLKLIGQTQSRLLQVVKSVVKSIKKHRVQTNV